MYHSHRPKEKVHLDKNKIFDSNSNLGARTQRHRLPVQRTPEKTQSMLGSPVLRPAPVLPPSHNHTHKARSQLPTLPGPAQGSNQDPPFYQTMRPASPPLPPSLEPRKEPLQCEVSGKEAISALSRARSRECRQQIVQVYCRHKERALMPEQVPRYCPIPGEGV